LANIFPHIYLKIKYFFLNHFKEEYSIEEIASISRELSFNDPFIVDQFDDALSRTGTKLDRNVELLIFNPLHCNKK